MVIEMREEILVEGIRGMVKEVFYEIAEGYDLETDRCKVAEDQVDVLVHVCRGIR